MPFQIIRDNLIHVNADAIVNSANPAPVIGGGTERAIYEAAGTEKLLAARQKIGALAPGECAPTKAFGLSAKYILHTVSPVWEGGGSGERETLRACYAKTLELAEKCRCKSVAFPLIGSGAYGFPAGEALTAALSEIQKFLLKHEMLVLLVVFNSEALAVSEKLVGEIDQYIDDHGVKQALERESTRRRRYSALFTETGQPPMAPQPAPMMNAAPMQAMPMAGSAASVKAGKKSLDEVVRSAEKTFQQRLFELIDASGMDEVTVYKKANLDRKLFSRIRSRKDYRPAKRTALALAIALELDLPTTEDLLSRAEIALSPSSIFDLIISYFITQRNYDIYEINTALFHYGQPMLGFEE